MLKIAYHPIYSHELPAGHRFPMEKYDLLPEQLLYEGTCIAENFFTPEIPNNKHFFTVHDPEYFFDLFNISLSQKAARKIIFQLFQIWQIRFLMDLLNDLIKHFLRLEFNFR